jgi:murein DD-endopeptidase MepM/ murein hydrolase activator NlpD
LATRDRPISRTSTRRVLVLVALLVPGLAFGQVERVIEAEMPRDHMSAAERARIWRELDAAAANLPPLAKAGARPAFEWPLRATRGYTGPGFVAISNFVDHDATFPGHLRDYTCGTRTYDLESGYNHQGTDIALWPDGWNVMAARQVEIVAAAPGTILYKNDGNFDQNCALSDRADWNAVYVMHDDGSVAWYGHMKSGSPTSKRVGDRVVAGEYLGSVGSSGSSTGPHLHFEVYDSSHQLIDPWAGQCNPSTADSWWAHQQPYYVPTLNRAFTASAVAVSRTCGVDGRMSDPGTINEKSAFAPGDSVIAVVATRDMQPGTAVNYTIRAPNGAAFRQTAGTPVTGISTGYRSVTYPIDATWVAGTYLFEAELDGVVASAPFSVTPTGEPPANYTDLWWNPAESGWGINVVHQASVVFATWFTYDADSAGMWLVMPDARLQGDGSFSGAIYRTTGTPFAQINGQASANSPPSSVGTATLRFGSASQGTFSYTVNGVSQSKSITRQAFSTPTRCTFTAGSRASLTNFQDLWWNPAESGWGINLAHQGEILFATWFTYGTGGRGQWLVGPEVRREPTGEYRGRLYRTTGRPFNLINGAFTTANADVGTVTLTFSDGEHARLDYTLDGIAQSKDITRQVFGSPATLCR